MRAIIIGAGIAGLSMAQALNQAGFQVKIYEKAKKLSNIGGGILIWPHGMRSLRQLGIHKNISPFKVSLERCNVYSLLGEKIFTENYTSLFQALGGEILPIERNILQNSLLQGIPKNCIEFGKKCISITHNHDGAQVIFEDGAVDSADLVIGADGIHSIVGQHVAEKNSSVYTNNCWWGGIVERKYVPHFLSDESHTILGKGKVCIVWPTFDDKLMWYIAVKMPVENLVKNDERQQLKEICKDWNEDVNKIISAPMCDKNFQIGIYELQPRENWSHERVTLIGDAAHAIGPLLGQGASLAIEDSIILVKCLQEFDNDISAAIRHFEQLRYPVYHQIFKLENQAANMMITEDVEALEMMQQQLPNLDLISFYQDLIPLVVEDSVCINQLIS